jgi:acyl-CoA dehydrogenase
VVAGMLMLVVLVLSVAGILALATLRAPLWAWALALLALTSALQIGFPALGWFKTIGWLSATGCLILSIPVVRRKIFVIPIYHAIRRTLPRVSDTARQAIEGGTVSFDADLFSGKPDWKALRAIPPITLSQEERAFLDGPTEELCWMIDGWQIRHHNDIPPKIWTFMKTRGFFGLRIAREHGGLGFSAQALSLILGKIASRSPDVFSILMIPNSLGLGELIEAFGTEAQKRMHLPRLATGQDIPCLAITGPLSGSDAANMRDIGFVTRGTHAGSEVVGIQVSWDKRYVALAPGATLIGITFRLFDPQNLLGKVDDLGITLAIVPARHHGVQIGRRHWPAGAAFPIGPTSGHNVFIPLSWIIGGEIMAGQGWRTMMDCLSASRAIALPACAAAGAKAVLRISTAYATVRRQFGFSIAKMQGPEERLARLVEAAYVSEAGRAVTAAMVSRGEQPSVISALLKYQSTERLRLAINDAMDLHGGRAIFDGPTNYLQSMYQMVPATITVEGANIVMRSLIAFTQGALRSHPYLPLEVSACQDEDESRGLAAFEKALLGHISFMVSNISGAFWHNVTGGRFSDAPAGASGIAKWYRQLGRACRSFALVADIALVTLGRSLRTRQKLTGRLADAMSELFLLACVLKRFEDDGRPADDCHFVAFAALNALWRFQEAMRGTIDNFPIPWVRILMKIVVFPFGAPHRPAPDRLGHKIVTLALKPGETRDRLTRCIYVSKDERDPTGLLEIVFAKSIEVEEIERKVDQAARRRLVHRYHGIDWISDAVKQNVITDREGDLLRELDALVARVTAVDDFDSEEMRPNYMTAGHNTKAAQNLAEE